MPKVALTAKYLDALKGAGAPYEIADSYCPGLRLIVRATGRHSWIWRGHINGKAKKYPLGLYPLHSLTLAREWASDISRNRDRGIDVVEARKDQENAERQRSLRTCDWLFAEYMKHEGERRRSSPEKWRLYNREIAPIIGDRSYTVITHNELARLLQAKAISAPSVSNALQSLIRRWFRWSVTVGRHISDLDIDPAADLTKLAELRSRDRSLDNREIALLLKVLLERETPFADPVRLILYTGVRRGEAFGMRWDEIDLGRGDWLIPRDRTKNGIELLLPLPAVMQELLKAAFEKRRLHQSLVWASKSDPRREMSGFSKIVSTLNADMQVAACLDGYEVAPWSIHDLRRTVVSGMNGLLDETDRPIILPHVVERVVNHKLAGVQGVYNRHSYYAEKKAALLNWAMHLQSLVFG